MYAQSRSVRITVPASTANLGPGFDALALALACRDEVHITPRRKVIRSRGAGDAVTVRGEGAGEVPEDACHLVVRALHAAAEEIGYTPPGLDLACHNAIPHARGLGSSGAAIVAGVLGAYALAGRDPDDGALQVAAELEGHADNVAASLYGGLVVAFSDAGRYRAARLVPDERLAPVVFVPRVRSATHAARGLLPATVPHADAAHAAGRAALAVHALTSEPQLLTAATEDRLHQEYRGPAWPASLRLVRRLRERGWPAVISGAGPSVLALPARAQQVGNSAAPPDVESSGFDIRHLPVDRAGACVDVVPGVAPGERDD
jgi:homoserine kinase